jgi:hypothetical protein
MQRLVVTEHKDLADGRGARASQTVGYLQQEESGRIRRRRVLLPEPSLIAGQARSPLVGLIFISVGLVILHEHCEFRVVSDKAIDQCLLIHLSCSGDLPLLRGEPNQYGRGSFPPVEP